MKSVTTQNNYKLVAPDIDRLLRFFDRRYLNPSGTTEKLNAAMEPLFKAFVKTKFPNFFRFLRKTKMTKDILGE